MAVGSSSGKVNIHLLSCGIIWELIFKTFLEIEWLHQRWKYKLRMVMVDLDWSFPTLICFLIDVLWMQKWTCWLSLSYCLFFPILMELVKSQWLSFGNIWEIFKIVLQITGWFVIPSRKGEAKESSLPLVKAITKSPLLIWIKKDNNYKCLYWNTT